jgi:hypothetical protein
MRPRKPHQDDSASAGSKLRDALARKQADDEMREVDEAARKEDALRQSVSNWFNTVAAKLPQAVKDITTGIEAGRDMPTNIDFAAEDSISVRGVTGIKLDTLPGFQALDKACKDLDVYHTVVASRHGYGRKSTAGKEYLHVGIDVTRPHGGGTEPAKPVDATARRPRRPGPRFR